MLLLAQALSLRVNPQLASKGDWKVLGGDPRPPPSRDFVSTELEERKVNWRGSYSCYATGGFNFTLDHPHSLPSQSGLQGVSCESLSGRIDAGLRMLLRWCCNPGGRRGWKDLRLPSPCRLGRKTLTCSFARPCSVPGVTLNLGHTHFV